MTKSILFIIVMLIALMGTVQVVDAGKVWVYLNPQGESVNFQEINGGSGNSISGASNVGWINVSSYYPSGNYTMKLEKRLGDTQWARDSNYYNDIQVINFSATQNYTFTATPINADTWTDKTNYNIGEVIQISYSIENMNKSGFSWILSVYSYEDAADMSTPYTDWNDWKLTTSSGTVEHTVRHNGTYRIYLTADANSNLDYEGGAVTNADTYVNGSDATYTSFVSFDSDEYYKGSTATIEYGINPSFLHSYELEIYYNNGLQDHKSVSGFGTNSINIDYAGTYRVDLLDCVGFSCTVIASDEAEGIFYPSYIGMPSNVIAGVLFNVTYVWGSQPGSQALGKWIYVDYYNPDTNTWEREQPYIVTQSTPNTQYNTSVLTKKAGKYKITLCDLYTSYLCPAAEKIITSSYGGNVPIVNYSSSSINITAKQSSYAQGDYMTFTYFVSGSDFSNKTVSVEIYNNASFRNISVYHIQQESGNINYFLSGILPYEAGANQLRLMGTNNSGRYVLAYDSFTLSVIDTYGYGLTADKYTVCEGDPVVITSILPININGTIRFTEDSESTAYNISGTRTFKIYPYSDLSVSLDVGTDQKKYALIEVNNECGTSEAIQGVSSGDMGTGFKALLDGWFGNSESTRYIEALIIIIVCGYLAIKFTRHTGLSVGISILAMGGTIVMGLLPMVWGVIAVIIAGVLFAKKAREGF